MADELETKPKKASKITKKQKYILISLLGVLVVVVFVVFLIKPMIEQIQTNTETYAQLSAQYDSLLLQSQGYEANLKNYNSAKSKKSTETAKWFDLMNSEDADKGILTPMVKEIGFTVSQVSISELTACLIDSSGVASTQTMTYDEAMEYTEVDPTEEETETVATLETEDTGDGSVTYGEASENLADNEAVAETENLIYNTGEYYYTFSYTLTGSYSDIVTLVENVTKEASMSLESITFQSVSDETTKIEGDYSVSAVINIYMYEDPSTGINDTVEDETATETEGESATESEG